MEASLDERLRLEPLTDIEIEIDNAALPWHTMCSVTGRDRPGTLAALAAAMSSAGVVVHSARVTTVDGRLVDRFALTDRLGRKLDDRALAKIRSALAGTVPAVATRLAFRAGTQHSRNTADPRGKRSTLSTGAGHRPRTREMECEGNGRSSTSSEERPAQRS